MNRLLHLIGTDFKQIGRDKTLAVFIWQPFILLAIARYGIPVLAEQFSFFAENYVYFVMFGSVQSGLLFGFVSSFLMLEEKDEHVLQVIRVLPISSSYFIFYRLIFSAVFSFLGAFFMIHLSGLVDFSLMHSLILSFSYSLSAPFITIFIATYAANKIEGLAFFKGVNLFLILPILAFVFGDWAQYLFMIFPSFWTFKSVEYIANQQSYYSAYWIGVLVYSLLFVGLFTAFKKRVFNT